MASRVTRHPCCSTYFPADSNRLYFSLEICGLVESSSCDGHALDRFHLLIAESKISLDLQPSRTVYDRSGKFVYFLCTGRVRSFLFNLHGSWCHHLGSRIGLVYWTSSKVQTGKTAVIENEISQFIPLIEETAFSFEKAVFLWMKNKVKERYVNFVD